MSSDAGAHCLNHCFQDFCRVENPWQSLPATLLAMNTLASAALPSIPLTCVLES